MGARNLPRVCSFPCYLSVYASTIESALIGMVIQYECTEMPASVALGQGVLISGQTIQTCHSEPVHLSRTCPVC